LQTGNVRILEILHLTIVWLALYLSHYFNVFSANIPFTSIQKIYKKTTRIATGLVKLA